jgi:hypothetical protein
VWLAVKQQQQQGQLQFAEGMFRSRLWTRLNDVHGILHDGSFSILGTVERLLELDANLAEAGAQLHMSRGWLYRWMCCSPGVVEQRSNVQILACCRASSLVERCSLLKSRTRGTNVKRAAALLAGGEKSAVLKLAKDCTLV